MDLLFSNDRENLPAGFWLGKVTSNYDEKHKGMVKVQLHGYQSGGDSSCWMRVVSPIAGKNRGFYFLPEVGDEVLIGFIDNDIDSPVVIGALWNNENDYPGGVIKENNELKKLVTKSGLQIVFEEEEKKEAIQLNTPQNLTIRLADENKLIEIKDDGKNQLIIDASNGQITIKAEKKLVLEANAIEITAKDKLTLGGNKVEISGKNEAALTGSSKVSISGGQIETDAKGTLALKSGGITQLKGSLVKING